MNDIERAMRVAREEHTARWRKASGSGRESDRHTLLPQRFDDQAFEIDVDATALTEAHDAAVPATPSDPSVPVGERSVARTSSQAAPSLGNAAGRGETDPASGQSESSSEHPIRLSLEHLAREGFVTPDLPKGRLSEEYRRIKRPILRNIADGTPGGGHSNVIAVTSSVAGEGKTYTAINLAMSLAMERERTVVLIDGDVLKGTAGRTLGVDRSRPGLIDLLSDDDGGSANVIFDTDVQGLRFVPAGRMTDRATELLSSARMKDFIDEIALRHPNRIVVLDCPPMLQTNEANALVEHAGQVVFVVAAEETDRRLVLEAMRHFDDKRSVGVLLNKARVKSVGYYDYGYGNA